MSDKRLIDCSVGGSEVSNIGQWNFFIGNRGFLEIALQKCDSIFCPVILSQTGRNLCPGDFIETAGHKVSS